MITIEIFTSSSTTMIRIKIKIKITKIIIILKIDSMGNRMKVISMQNKITIHNKIEIIEIIKNSMGKMRIPMKIICTMINLTRTGNRPFTMKVMVKNRATHRKLPKNQNNGNIIKIQILISMIKIQNNLNMEKILMIN